MTTDWKTIASHPAADMFPMMTGDRHAELVESIRRDGLRVPIVLCDGMVLDGRNRLRACLEAGVEPRATTLEGDGNPYEYVWDLNGQRRDLAPDQRMMIAIEIDRAAVEWEERKKRAEEEKNAKIAEKVAARPRDQSGAFIPISLSRDNEMVEDAEETDDGEDDADLADAQAVARDAILDAGQRAMIAIQAEKPAVRTPRPVQLPPIPSSKPAPTYARTHEQLAKKANVSSATAARSQSLYNKRPDLAKQIARGEMKLTEAMRQVKREEVAAKVEPLPSGPTKYRVIYADPPWQYNDSRAGLDGYAATAAEDHYPTMSTADICALDIKALAADDSVLLCWATFPMLTDALAVVTAWGFKYKTAIVWDKVRSNFGHYHNASAELLLICTRGSGVPDASHRVDQVQVLARVGKHSEKPEEFRALIDRLWTSGKRIELFRRGEAPSGWEVWGNEAAGEKVA